MIRFIHPMSNAELRTAIESTHRLRDKTVPNTPTMQKLAEHLHALLDIELQRASVVSLEEEVGDERLY